MGANGLLSPDEILNELNEKNREWYRRKIDNSREKALNCITLSAPCNGSFSKTKIRTSHSR